MKTTELFSDFLREIGSPNFLAIGILIIVLWLVLSGFIKGLKKRRQDGGPTKNDKDD